MYKHVPRNLKSLYGGYKLITCLTSSVIVNVERFVSQNLVSTLFFLLIIFTWYISSFYLIIFHDKFQRNNLFLSIMSFLLKIKYYIFLLIRLNLCKKLEEKVNVHTSFKKYSGNKNFFVVKHKFIDHFAYLI